MWKNIVERGRPQMTIWRMRIECWITKATNTHWEYVTHCFSTTIIVERTPLNVTLYVQRLACAKIVFSVHGRRCHLYLRNIILCLHKACMWEYSDPGGGEFLAPVQTGPKDHSSSRTICTGSLSRGVKRAGRGVALTTHPIWHQG